MKSLSLAKPKNKLQEAFAEAKTIAPTVIFFFAAPSLLRDADFVAELAWLSKDIPLIGCSTAGEIAGPCVFQDSFALLAIAFETTQVRVVHAPTNGASGCIACGEALGDMLKGPKLKFVMAFGPGTDVNGSALVEGLSGTLGRNVLLTGGLAADETHFKQTFTLCNGEMFTDHAVAVGFYGDNVIVSCGSEGGWRPFGPARRVTKAENNILYELDGKPALQLYKQYLGEKARQLPASGLSYPFAVLRADRTTSSIIRSALNIDHTNESLVMAGNIEQGCQVCLMHADTVALTQGAAQAAAEALRTHAGPEENGCAIVVSCIGRRVVLGIDVEDETETVIDSFLPGIPVAGYYAYGEICSVAGAGRAELRNQNLTLTYITEKRGE